MILRYPVAECGWCSESYALGMELSDLEFRIYLFNRGWATDGEEMDLCPRCRSRREGGDSL